MPYYRCQIKYKTETGSSRIVYPEFEAKNTIDARHRAEGMYPNVISVHVSQIRNPLKIR